MMNEGLAQPNGFVVFCPLRWDRRILPRRQGFGHVVCFISDPHSPARGLWLHYPCRPGLWRPRVVEEGIACKGPDGEVYSVPDAIRAGLLDLDLNGNPDGSAIIMPWHFPSHPSYRPWMLWRRTSTGQAKHLMGVKAFMVRTPVGLHAWMTATPEQRRVTAPKLVRGLWWLTVQTFYVLRWMGRSAQLGAK